MHFSLEYAGINASGIEEWPYDMIGDMLDRLIDVKQREKAEIQRIKSSKK